MRSQALRADILMLITAMIWGVSFVAQRLGMDAIGPFLYTGLRFVLGALVLVPLLMLRSRREGAQPFNRGQLLAGIILGVALTTGINLQQVGLLFTSVTNSGFITGLYVIVVPLLGLLFGQRRAQPGAQAGALVWGAHVLLVGLFASRYDPIRLAFLQFATCAVVSLLLALVFEEIHWDAIVQAGPALLYGGLLGVGTGFTLQVVAQKHAIASHAAIILSLEAVFAAIAGALFLSETLHLRGYFGCALMLAGMLVGSPRVERRRR